MDIRYTHTDTGRVYWERNQSLQSTATQLGPIAVPSTMTLAEQEAEVRRRVEEFVAGLRPDDEGHVILAEDYYHDMLLRRDWQGHLDVRREEVSRNADGDLAVEAMAQRPLQAGRPRLYVDAVQHAMAEEAFEDTDGKCLLSTAQARQAQRPPGLGRHGAGRGAAKGLRDAVHAR